MGGLAGCVVFMGIDAVGVYFAWVGNSARARGCGGEDGKGAIVGVDGVGKGKGERERDGGDGWSGGKGVDVEKGAVELMDGGEWFGG